MSRRFKFENQSQLEAAFARIVDQGWVDSCTVDVPSLELRVQVGGGARERRHAEAWIARERRQRRRRSPAHD
jgi:hypothetical protein